MTDLYEDRECCIDMEGPMGGNVVLKGRTIVYVGKKGLFKEYRPDIRVPIDQLGEQQDVGAPESLSSKGEKDSMVSRVN